MILMQEKPKTFQEYVQYSKTASATQTSMSHTEHGTLNGGMEHTLGKSERSMVHAMGLQAVLSTHISHVVGQTTSVTTQYQNQLQQYVQNSCDVRSILTRQGEMHMKQVGQIVTNPTASQLRDNASWRAVKYQVVREELMNLQISGKTDLPLSPSEIVKLSKAIEGKDLTLQVGTTLTNSNCKNLDPEVSKIMDELVLMPKFDNLNAISKEREFLTVLKHYKTTGQSNPLLQQGKLDKLSQTLENLDLSHLSKKEFDSLVKNYCEVTEYHHRTSISQDPRLQNNPDNIDPLKRTEHRNRHSDAQGKTQYQKPVKQKLLNRQENLKIGNRKRVFRNELKGLGTAVALGVGVGFALSFVTEIMISGISTENVGMILGSSMKSSVEAGGISAMSYGAGRLTTSLIEKLGMDVASRVGAVANMTAVGMVSIVLISGITYWKLRKQRASSETIRQILGKQVAMSSSILVLSILTQSVWGGTAGIFTSFALGAVLTATSVVKAKHDSAFQKRLTEFTVEQYKPEFS